MNVYKIKNKIRSLRSSYSFVNRFYLFANHIKTNALRRMDDSTYAKIKYKENTGRTLNLEKPITFNEKLWWLKIYNRDPKLTLCSDKAAVREYVKSKGLEELLIPIYGIYEKPEDIDFAQLPDTAFIKTTHGSGTNRLWNRNQPFDVTKFNREFSRALKQNYYLQSREWNYKDIPPRIIVEEVLEDCCSNGLVDYKFLCFDGKVKILFTDIEVAAEDGTHNPDAKRNVYDRDFHLLDVKVKRENFDPTYVEKPQDLDLMIKYAEILSEPFPFCRVDLYYVNQKIYFGEMTFYTGGATQIVEPEEWEKRMGEWIDLNSKKIKRNTYKASSSVMDE